MPLSSVSNATVTELFKGSAKFGRPSTIKGAGWVVTADKGKAIIQKQKYQDGTIVLVVRWTNYMDLDGLNGRILPDLPILRQHDSVYFKTSSTTTRGKRHKAPFCFKFADAEQAEKFEMCWLTLNGSITSGKEEDAKKEAGSSSNNKNLPLQDTTNAASTPLRSPKRKAGLMNEGSLRMKLKVDNRFLAAIGGGDIDKNVDGKVPALSDGRANDDDGGGGGGIPDPCVVGALKTVELMPKVVDVNGKLRVIVKAKRSILKSIAEDLTEKNVDGKVPALSDGRADDDDGGGIFDPCVVGALKTAELMPKVVNVSGKLRVIVKAKHSILKSIAEDLTEKNEEGIIDLNGGNSKNLDDDGGSSNDDGGSSSDDDDDSSTDFSSEDVIVDDEDAPQSQNWMTAFAPY